jgi:hypothetical protein
MLLNYKQPGNYKPHVIKEDLSVGIGFSPPDEDHYIVQAAGNIPKGFTGKLLGRLTFVNGICYARTYFDVKLAETRGCREITPPDVKERMLNRPLKKILVIRNAAFGDCLMLTPALRALRQKYPHATIDVFGRKDSRVVYENLPFIDGILMIRDTELGALVDEYDEVFDLIHSIECKPEADYMNALDVAANLLGVEIKDTRPIYNSTPREVEDARRCLLEMGIVPGRDKLIVIQAEATAKVRSLPYTTSLTVANQLALRGYKVLFVGHDMNLPGVRMLVHGDTPETMVRIAEPVPPGTRTVLRPHPSTGKEIQFQVADNHPNVIFAHRFNNKKPPRVHFAVCHFAQLVIAVDSFWSHLAAALDKPCVTIYSNYHPFTRTKYYDKTSIVVPDYKKVACGPCNGLFNTCPMFEGRVAPCIGSISPKKILEAADKRLAGMNPIFEEMRDNPPAVLDEARPCPMCMSTKHHPVTCKGTFIYVQCAFCETIFTAEYPDEDYWKTLRSKVKKNPYYRKCRNVDPKIFIDAISQGMKNCDRPLPKVPVTDLVSTNDKFHNRKAWKDYFDGKMVQASEKDSSPIQTELTIWADGLMEQEKPVVTIEKLMTRIQPGNYLALIIPLVDRYDRINTWKPLNPPVAGMHTVIPTQRALRIYFDKDHGLMKDRCQLVFISLSDEASIVMLQKPKEWNSSGVSR